ncbi:unnamed protein product [Phyllotreta striolata]|uniref:Protein LTV1 homolog n=1 Tax=Phyllotreta striolata TaxID=444603 RepID=A0A9N9TX76_PHYSR|nr:unnamed protein product [Phyllotreta striolata]
MPKHKINKKDAVTFQVVHRSQQDPLIADEDAPQRVLVPIKPQNESKHPKPQSSHKPESSLHSDDEDIEEPREFSIKVALPPVVFASEVEEEVGMLGKAAPVSGPQLHLDPDVVAAMDDDFDYSDPENELEDNFIELAKGDFITEEGEEEDMNSDFSDECDSFDEEDERWKGAFDKEETKSRFTNYSITSSVIRRNENLRLLDEKFEKMFIDYDENEIGALDLEEIEGDVSSNILLDSALKEFTDVQKIENNEQNKTNLAALDDGSDEDLTDLVVVDSKKKWDCESILSSYSNIFNHPKKIVEPKSGKIRINKKTGIPNDVFTKNGLTVRTLDKLNQQNDLLESKSIPDHTSQLSMLSQRSKHETPEDRRVRKQKLKEYRKDRRIEKKLNTQAFKDEYSRQIKIDINNRNNVQGNKIL